MDTQSPWLDDDQQDLWQALHTVVVALPAALDRQLQRDAGISNFEYGVPARLSAADKATMRLSDSPKTTAKIITGTNASIGPGSTPNMP
ncbi:hypothetical protein [Embleya sp. NPDC005971]|uniref:hypothetical protein n=1 Tax=Embleya sp. NPDC005971 TaxID=3156724 RepID=UPI0033E8C6B5